LTIFEVINLFTVLSPSMSRNRLILAGLLLLLAGPACQVRYRPQTLSYDSRLIQKIAPDTAMQRFLEPYAAKVGSTMNDVIGRFEKELQKQSPDGSLGHFLADSYLEMARRRYDPGVQVAFINSGGVRIPSIQAGSLRRGTIYEVMPFDNLLVILKVTGVQLQEYLDHIAADGGGGVAGMTMRIKDRKATDVMIGGRPIDPSATYVMANSDYTVSGGGGYQGLRNLPANKTGYLLRDATIDYCLSFHQKGEPIPVPSGKRITNAQ
jgi:2',3'-cyclic-nucleotide 2'-phosphodiesterase (5'-nucleotidase family)